MFYITPSTFYDVNLRPLQALGIVPELLVQPIKSKGQVRNYQRTIISGESKQDVCVWSLGA